MFLCHRQDGSHLDEDRKFPEWSLEIIDDASSRILIAGEIVYPFSFRQVDTVADVVPLLVGLRVAIDRSHQHERTVQELIAGSRSVGIFVRIIQEHGAYHRFTVNRFAGDAIGVWHEGRFHLQVHAVDGSCRFAQDMRILRIGSPAVHVQLHRRKGLPLEIADVDRYILSTEDTVHIRGDVRLSGKAGTDVGRDVETDVFPFASGLVARPYARIALGTCPSVQ